MAGRVSIWKEWSSKTVTLVNGSSSIVPNSRSSYSLGMKTSEVAEIEGRAGSDHTGVAREHPGGGSKELSLERVW